MTLVDTGENSMTGGRLKRVRDYVDSDFCFTYGDGLSDLDINAEIEFHRSHGKLATVCAVQPPGRFGVLEICDERVVSFSEKINQGSSFINGGFFILSPKVIDFIDGDDTSWEREPLERLAAEGELRAYHHASFGSQWILCVKHILKVLETGSTGNWWLSV